MPIDRKKVDAMTRGAGQGTRPPLPKTLSTDEAIQFCASKRISVSKPTIIKWCREIGIGKQVGGRGRWFISLKKLNKQLEDLTRED